MKAPRSFKITDHAIGSGRPCVPGDIAICHCTCTRRKGDVLFASDAESPYPIRVGGRDCYAGIEYGLLGMRIGGRRKVIVPPNLIYDERKTYSELPANGNGITIRSTRAAGNGARAILPSTRRPRYRCRYPIEIRMTDNPFRPPLTDSAREPLPPRRRAPRTRSELAGKISLFGFLGGGLVGTVGFLVLIAAIELLLTPPFKSPPNYGQFGIVVIGVGFYAAIFGVCLGIVPYVSWLGYIPVHLIGLWLIWSIDKQFFQDVGWTEAPIVAMFAIFTLPTPIAACIGWWANRYPRIADGG